MPLINNTFFIFYFCIVLLEAQLQLFFFGCHCLACNIIGEFFSQLKKKGIPRSLCFSSAMEKFIGSLNLMSIILADCKRRAWYQPKKKRGLPREGIARCTFEDRILVSNLVLLHAWIEVEVPCFFNPLTTALQPHEQT